MIRAIMCVIVSNSDVYGYGVTMDVLSDVVAAARTGRPHSSRVAYRAPFGHRFPAMPAAGFHVVLQGACLLVRDEAEPVPLAPGDVAFLPHGSAHGLADSPSTRVETSPVPLTGVRYGPSEEPPDARPTAVTLLCGGYLLDRAGPHPLLHDLPEVVRLSTGMGRHPELHAAVGLLGAELQRSPRPGAEAVLAGLLDLLLLYVLRAWFEEHREAENTAAGWAAALHDPAVSAALRAMHEAPAHPWTVEALAARARLSRAALARRFTRLVGRAPLTYLTWWRLTTAARQLRTGDAPVHAIARGVGYTSQHAFTHAFKRQYGTPPRDYRRDQDPAATVIATAKNL